MGTAVTLLGLRHPVTVASELASLDAITNGRSFFAFGLGYREEELRAFHLLTEDHVSFDGKEFALSDVTVDPKPIQKPRPPIWIAANSDRAVRRAAALGDGWLVGPHSAIEELEAQVAIFRSAWREAGKQAPPQIPIIRETFTAPTRQKVVEKAQPCLAEKLPNRPVGVEIHPPVVIRMAFCIAERGRRCKMRSHFTGNRRAATRGVRKNLLIIKNRLAFLRLVVACGLT